jgi:hypothetical protein
MAVPTIGMAALSSALELRLVDFSTSGCLLDSSARLAEGLICELRLVIDGALYTDAIQVTRCVKLQGAGSTYRIGAEFVWTTPPAQSVRLALASTIAPASPSA